VITYGAEVDWLVVETKYPAGGGPELVYIYRAGPEAKVITITYR
jgi:hypothetical protein